MEYVMLDIETLGNNSNSVILSISAVEFNKKGEYGEQFHVDIDPQSCMDIGLKMDISTVMWWLDQPDEARAQFTKDKKTVSIEVAINSFKQWFALVKARGFEKVFAKDPDFDCNLIEDACDKLRVKSPFGHRDKVAIRTLSWLRPNFEKEEVREGVEHNGIDDCKHQIKYVVKILEDLSLDFQWETPPAVHWSPISVFEPGDIIARKDDILAYGGKVPDDKTYLIKEDGVYQVSTDRQVFADPEALFGRIGSVLIE